MTNHVPDAALAAVDEVGRAWLRGDGGRLVERLRSDLRVRADWTPEDVAAGRLRVAFLKTGRAEPAVRDHGDYVATVVDGVEERFVAWGFRPPERYERVDTADHGGDSYGVYCGTYET